MKNEAARLNEFRRIEIRRPQYPWILEWVDPEFEVIYINICAMPGANVSCILERDDDEDEDPIIEEERRGIWGIGW